jgi:hypothetical protein
MNSAPSTENSIVDYTERELDLHGVAITFGDHGIVAQIHQQVKDGKIDHVEWFFKIADYGRSLGNPDEMIAKYKAQLLAKSKSE